MGRGLGVMLLGLGILLLLAAEGAAGERVFGPALYQRGTGAPKTYQGAFEVCDPSGSFRLVVENGPDGVPRVSSATVLLNGTRVVWPSDLNQQVAGLDRPVTLRGANEIEVRLASGPPGGLRLWIEATMRCLTVRITEPAAGDIVPGPWVLVRGEVRGLDEVGVTVNGVRASVEDGRFAAFVPLEPGEARLTVVATDLTGRVAADTVDLTVEAVAEEEEPAVELEVYPRHGLAPLTVTFTVREALAEPVGAVELDVDGDGVADLAAPEPGEFTYTYEREGLYLPTVTLTDATGGRHTARSLVHVHPIPPVEARWQAMRALLGQGDIEGALGYFTEGVREGYRDLFTALLPAGALDELANDLADFRFIRMLPEGVEGDLRVIRDGVEYSFFVLLVPDPVDGLWKIQGF